MNKLLLLLMTTIFLTACKEKADINKLFNEAEDKIELEFKYANVKGIDYSSVTGDFVYHLDYDKILNRFHIWTIRFADYRINETFDVGLNKFHCTETQICFDNHDIRVIIENAGESYIVHVYKLHQYSKFESHWEDLVTFHNSNERIRPSKPNNSVDNFTDIGSVETKQPVFTVVYATSDDGFVNIREQPSSRAKVLGKLHDGVDGLGEGVLIDKDASWCKIKAGNIVGWAYTKYLGFQTWYKGTGDSIMVANNLQTPIFENADVDEEEYKFAVVEKGTILADSFEEYGNYYVLQTHGTCLLVRKEDVKIVVK